MTDSLGRQWHIMERDDGSISIYYCLAQSPGIHYVVFDSMTDLIIPETSAAPTAPNSPGTS